MKNKIEINHTSPLYQQLANHIREKIIKGVYLPGTQLMNEDELTEYYGVSKTTVRNATDLLDEWGLIRKKHGVGMFVLPFNETANILNMTGMFNSNKKEEESELVDFYLRKAGLYYAHLFSIKEDELVYYARTVSKYEGEVQSITELYVPKDVFPQIEDIQLSVVNIIEILVYHEIEVADLVQTMELVKTSKVIHQLLSKDDEFLFLYKTQIKNEKGDVILEVNKYSSTEDSKYYVDFNL